MTQERLRYSDEELQEFEVLLTERLEAARQELESYRQQLTNEHNESRISLEDSVNSSELDYISRLASRQEKHIRHLENALVRIKNKVYGVCRATGKLISKDRLRAVPHATLSIDAKRKQR